MNGQFDIGDIPPLRYFLAVSLAFGLLFGLTTPDADDGLAILAIAQWVFQTLIAVLVIIGCQLGLARIPGFSAWSLWVQLILSGVIGAVLLTPLLSLLDQWTDTAGALRDTGLLRLWTSEFFGAAPAIVSAWLAMNLPFILGYRIRSTSPADDATSETLSEASTASIIEKIPRERRGELFYMEAELHYVKVVTSQGASLILYNLKDAAAELNTEVGMLCHRSFWVAFDAIDSFNRKGRQGLITLVDGTVIPVSRTKVGLVSAALKNRAT